MDIAKRVQKRVNAEIVVTSSSDNRSYRQNSDKLLACGFKQEYSIDDAIEEIIESYKSEKLKENEKCYTVSWMKQLKL